MSKKYNKFLISLCMLLLLLAGCGSLGGHSTTDTIPSRENNIETIADLQDTTHFRQGALAHIFEGEINRRGDAVGFHYDGLPTKKGHVINGTKTKPDDYGVYEAKVEVDGVKKKSNGGKSTLYSEKWDAQQVIDAINEAYSVRTFISGNTYEGLSDEGMRIRMYLDGDDKIISAFPVYEGG